MIGSGHHFTSFESLESFLDYFKENNFDYKTSFRQDLSDVNEVHQFVLKYSSPSQADSLPFLKAALILLLFHPVVQRRQKISVKQPPVRSILLQVIGRCVRRSARAQIKTLPITVPLLLPHLSSPDLFQLIISDLHLDLRDRFRKFRESDQLYNDPITANLLIVFDYFYLINESFHSIYYTGRIEPSFFYHQFPDNFDVCEDYAHWRELAEIPDRHLPFAFCDFPWIFNLDHKRILLMASNGLKQRHQLQDAFFRAIFDGVQSTCLHLTVNRANLLQEAREQLLHKPIHQLAKQLRISFIGEEGIDEGGLKKEFFQLCFHQIFSHSTAFREIGNSLFWFNDDKLEENVTIADDYKFVGILLALAIYNGVLVAPRFPLLLFKKLLNFPLQLDDYAEIDHFMVQSINHLAQFDVDGLFHIVPGREDVELIPHGTDIPVTPENKFKYISLLSDFFLTTATAWQFAEFRCGFELISGGSVIYGFRPDELFSLAYGTDDFDLCDLQSITTYEGGYQSSDPQINWLWTVVSHKLDREEQREFLAFVTGSARAPLGGLSRLKSFTVTRIPGDSERLPSAHTCFNTLLLPQYSTPSKLESKLRLAIKHHQGFGLI